MTTHLSYKHAVNSIRLLYKHGGFEFPEHSLGEQVSTEFKCDITASKLAPLYAFVDEQIALLRVVSWYFMSAFRQGDETPTAFYRITIRQLRTLSSIRLLCTFGLDTNARLQLRLLFENAILWSRLRVDPSALEEYVKSSSPEASNAFWHKYISKSKTEKFLANEFNTTGHVWLGGLEDAIAELKTIVSVATHPSMLGSYFDARQDWNDSPDNVALGETSEASHFTLSQAILVTSIPFSITPEPSYEITTVSLLDGLKPLAHPTQSWDEYNQHIRKMFPGIFLMSTRFSEKLQERQSDQA